MMEAAPEPFRQVSHSGPPALQNLLLALLTGLLLLVPTLSFAQEAPGRPDGYAPLDEEAPKALFTAALDDDMVEVFLAGFWKSRAAIGIAPVSPQLFPDHATIPWTNEIDLLMSVWYAEVWMAQAHIGDDLATSTLQVGYVNPEVDGLRKLVVGNAGIGFDHDYPGLGFGSAIDGIPGVVASWGFGNNAQEAMVRVQNSTTTRLVFRGDSAQDSQVLSAWVPGVSFQLPHRDVRDLRVWVQSGEGVPGSDGSRYRELGPGDLASADLRNGTLSLAVASGGKVLVSYATSQGPWHASSGNVPFLQLTGSLLDTSASAVYFDAAQGSTWVNNVYARFRTVWDSAYSLPNPWLDDGAVTLGGITCLVLHNPGETGPFDARNTYRPAGKTTVEGPRTIRADGKVWKAPAITQGPWTVLQDPLGTAYGFRYPLLGLHLSTFRPLYDPAGSANPLLTMEAARAGTSEARYPIGPGAIPETIRVTRNGMPDMGFRYDRESMSVLALFPVFPDDEIVITHETADRLGTTRLLQTAVGLHFDLGEDSRIGTSLSGTFGIADQGQGKLEHHFGMRLADPLWSLALSTSMGLGLPERQARGSGGNLASASVSIEASVDKVVPMAPRGIWTEGSRGEIRYHDFRTLTGFAAWNTRPFSGYSPLAAGKAMGPVVADAAVGQEAGRVLVMPFSLDTAQSMTWVGASLILDDSERQSASQAQSLRLWYRTADLSGAGTIELSMHAGIDPEDMDGDGRLDKPVPDSGTGVPHTWRGQEVLVRTQAGISLQNKGEDANLDGWLNPGDPHVVLQAPVTPSAYGELVIPLDDSARAVLGRSSAISLVLRSTAGATSGLLVAGGLKFEGIGVRTDPGSVPLDVTILKGSTIQSELNSLASQFPGALEGRAEDERGLLSSRASATGPASLTAQFPTLEFRGYRSVRFFVKPSGGISTVSFSLGDGNGGMTSTGTLPTIPGGVWSELRLEVHNLKWSLRSAGGTILNEGSLQQSALRQWNRLTISYASPLNETVLVYGLQPLEPLATLAGNISASYEIKSGEASLTLDGFEVVSKASLLMDVSGMGSALPEIARGDIEWARLRVNPSARLASIDTSVTMEATLDPASQDLRFGHGLTIPARGILPFHLSDDFRQGPGAGRLASAVHETAMHLGIDQILTYDAKARVVLLDSQIDRGFTSDAQFTLPLGLALVHKAVLEDSGANPADVTLDYWRDWIYSLSLMNPGEPTGKTYRQLSSELKLGFDAVGIKGASQISGSYSKGSWVSGNRKVTVSYGLELSSIPDASSWSWDLAYRREGSSQFSGGPDEDLTGSLEIWAAAMARDPSWWSIPLHDFIVPTISPRDESSTASSRKSSLELGLVRPRSNDVLDFLVPRSFEAKLSLESIRSAQSYVFGHSGMEKLMWQSFNLFGRTGSTGLFPWFESEENKISLGHEWGSDSWDLDLSIATQVMGLVGEADYQKWSGVPRMMSGVMDLAPPYTLALASDFSWNGGTSQASSMATRISWNWVHDIMQALDYRPESLRKGQVFMIQGEMFKIALRNEPAGQVPLQLSAELGHRTTLVLPGMSYLFIEAGIAVVDRHLSGDAPSSGAAAFKIGAELRVVF